MKALSLVCLIGGIELGFRVYCRVEGCMIGPWPIVSSAIRDLLLPYLPCGRNPDSGNAPHGVPGAKACAGARVPGDVWLRLCDLQGETLNPRP